jgi:hypothetical protein
MTRRSVEFFRDTYLPALAKTVNYALTARATGISESIIFRWIDDSKRASDRGDSPSPFYFEFEEREDWFHRHVRFIQQTVNNQMIESSARQRASIGIWVPSMFQGRRVPAQDPFLIGRPDLVDLLGLPDDLLRDETGCVVFEQTYIPPSTDIQTALLAANVAKYRKKVEIDNKVSGGVVIMSAQQRLAAPLPMLQVIEPEAMPEPEGTALRAEPEPDVTDTDPNQPPEAPGIQPGDRVEPVSYSVPTPPAYQSEPAPILRPLSDAERAILQRTNDRRK